MDPRPGTSDSFATEQQSGTDESEDEGQIQKSFGTTRFVEGGVEGENSKELGDSSGHEFMDEETDLPHQAHDGDTGEAYDDFPTDAIGDHDDFPPRPMSGHMSLDQQGFGPSAMSRQMFSMRPASSPMSQNGAPPLHGGQGIDAASRIVGSEPSWGL